MKRIIPFITTLLVVNMSVAQQLTETLTFLTNEVSFTQNNEYDVISMDDIHFTKDINLAGQPQLPIKTISLLLKQSIKIIAEIVVNMSIVVRNNISSKLKNSTSEIGYYSYTNRCA